MYALISAFRNSLRGLLAVARSERAVQQELLLLIAAVPAALWLSPNTWVRVSLVGAIMLVLGVEFLNTAIEKLCDHVNPGYNQDIGFIKDAGSAAVLFVIVLAALIWGAAAFEALR
ncbi:diacylglycerol kinase [Microvirga aerophila]|uniref:Diacylglycerol kinase n=1 Tax=Microvirga aerophila TaxID=670291 RepID=A0A512C5F9_9HYPH|nr:diacylglycerol kinase [Microvirga aerophila]GEO19448.1 diacylglycerol kinase [Microvirga aerophila]